jgi:phage-related minor tail protein
MGQAFAPGGSMPFPMRANGGPVTGGSPYIVGERGPELFVPGRSGMIVPNNNINSGGKIIVNVDASGTQVQGDDNRGQQLGRAVAAAVQQELIKQKRPGGLLA